MAWQDILDVEIIPGKPPKSSIFFRLRDNLEAVAKRLVGAWIVQVPVTVYLTSGTVWNIPDGVTAWEEELVGGGGGGGVGGTNGGGSTTLYNGLTVTAGGGASQITTGAGGVATNGDLNVPGQRGLQPGGGFVGLGGASLYGSSGMGTVSAAGYGAGGAGAGAGARAIIRRVRQPGLNTVTVTVGAAGAPGTGAAASAGAPGLVLITY